MARWEDTEEQDRDDSPRLWAEIETSDDEHGSRAVVRGRHELGIDEPPWVPIGEDDAPCPGDYLLVAAAGCQVEVLKQCLEKARIGEYDVRVEVERERSSSADAPDPFPEHLGIRYDRLSMELTVETTEEFEGRVRRCVEVCEDACLISRSVEAGVDIELSKDVRVRS